MAERPGNPRPLPTDLPTPGTTGAFPPPAPATGQLPIAEPTATTADAQSAVPPTTVEQQQPVPAERGTLETPLVIGEHRMAKSPAFNATWEICQIIATAADPNTPLVQFPDGTVYTADSVQLGGRVARTPAQPEQPPAAAPSLLNGDFNAFKSIIVSMDRQSKKLFDLPLDVLLTMIVRFANNRGLPANGRMGVYSGVALFVPDESTLDVWTEAYMLEVQRRLAEAGNPEM